MPEKIEISYLPIAEIVPYANNARSHSRAQIRQIARSLTEFGFISPVLIDETGVLIAGHGRVLAAKQLGLKLIPAIRADHLNPTQVRAYRLADNKLAENAGWADDLLRIELEYLTSLEIDFDIDALGFSVTETDLILGDSVAPSSDDELSSVPASAVIISRLGDIWNLGPHRIIVGDCRNPGTMDQLMQGAMANMVLTDPPFNVPINGHVSGLGKHQHREFPMATGEMNPAEFTQFLADALQQLRRVSADGSLHYVFMDFRHMGELLAAGTSVFERLLNVCVWVKSNGGMGSLYRSQHELIYVFKKGTASHRNNVELGKNGRYRTNVWSYAGANAFGADRDEALAMHPTVKPVQMLVDAILDVTGRGDIVLDSFLGSGSTLIAAERAGRVCYGVELDPAYVDLTVRRWQDISGERATFAGTDLDIDQIAADRDVVMDVVT